MLATSLLAVTLLSVPPVVQADSLRIIATDRYALQARIDLIQRAQHSIDVAYYAVDTDEVPIAMLELLRRASRRGVQVRLLVDGLKSRVPSKFEQYLRRNGLQIRVYHKPCHGRPRWLNRRLHSKLIVADSNTAMIGSRNLENEYYGLARDKTFVDCDALLTGQIAQHAQRYFEWLWNSPDVQRAPLRDSLGLDILRYRPQGQTPWNEAWRRANSPADFQRLLDEAVTVVVCRAGVQLESTYDWAIDALHDVEMSLLHDRRLDKSERHVRREVVRMLDAATCSILIESPYPAFDTVIRSAISRARRRGVQITILTNSLESTDQLNVYAAYQNQKRSLLREGVRLQEFCCENTLHAKSLIVDNKTWMLGSYNFDARSDNLNLELCVVSNDPAGAAQLRSSVHKRLAASTTIAHDRLLLPVGRGCSLKQRARLGMKRTYIELYRCFL